jgi:hypothetical protein
MCQQNDGRRFRLPVPAGFERMVARLENHDSIVFKSISFPASQSTADPSDPSAAHRAFPPPESSEVSPGCGELLDRVRALEAAARQKDAEIARLRKEIGFREAQASLQPDAAQYLQQYEDVKREYDRLKAALAAHGKMRYVRKCAARPLKVPR